MSPEISTEMLNRMLGIVEKQADALSSLNEHQRLEAVRDANAINADARRDALLERVAETLERIDRSNAEGRNVAVDQINGHTTSEIQASGRWPTIWLGILSAAAVVVAAALALQAARGH